MHQPRGDDGGDAPALTRGDGATCWRAAIEVNTPSARRIHEWTNGTAIEFSRVVIHDDMRS